MLETQNFHDKDVMWTTHVVAMCSYIYAEAYSMNQDGEQPTDQTVLSSSSSSIGSMRLTLGLW